MSSPRPSTTLFEDAIDVPVWLENDRATPYSTRARRDRDIGSQLSARNAVQRVRTWWDLVERGADDPSGARLQRIRRLVTAMMIGIGGFLGVGVALAAFHYDGSRPVNVVTLLATLVIVATRPAVPHSAADSTRRTGSARHSGSVGNREPGCLGRFDLSPHRPSAARRCGAVRLASRQSGCSRPVCEVANVVLVADRRGDIQPCGHRNRCRAGDVHRSRVRLEHDVAGRSARHRALGRRAVAALASVGTGGRAGFVVDRTFAVLSAGRRTSARYRCIARTDRLVGLHHSRDRRVRTFAAPRAVVVVHRTVASGDARVAARRSARYRAARPDDDTRHRDSGP